jgi:hypothetical protein
MVRSLLHKGLHAFGFDIISIKKMDEVLERRDRARQQELLSAFCRLRDLPKKSVGKMNSEAVWVDKKEMLSAAVQRMRPADVVLDIGCAFRPQQYIDARTHICCEPYKEYMDRLQLETAGASKYVYLNTDFTGAISLFPEKSVDTIFMVDVIEHIDREIGQAGIERLKQIARSQIILFTPLGYMEQDPDENGVDQWGMGGVDWQKHRSGWLPDEFPVAAGWTTVSCKDFHEVDGYYRTLESPKGAFWAIWDAP